MPEDGCDCAACVAERKSAAREREENITEHPKLADRERMAKSIIDTPLESCIVCGRPVGNDGQIVFNASLEECQPSNSTYYYHRYHLCSRHAANSIIKCEHCGIPMLNCCRRYGAEGDLHHYCPICADDYQEGFTCAYCGRKYNADAEPQVLENLEYCVACYETYARKCHYCGAIIMNYAELHAAPREDLINACNPCVEKKGGLRCCTNCEEPFLLDDLEEFGSGWFCPECVELASATCVFCGGPNFTDSKYCAECGRPHIYPYDYRVPKLHPVGKRPWYGLELETTGYAHTEDLHTCSAAIWRASDGEKLVYQKRDGTINDGNTEGVELCFHPRAIDRFFDKEGRYLLKTFTGIVRQHGGYSYKGGYCGIHFHRCLGRLGKNENKLRLFRAMISLEPFLYILAQRTGVVAIGTQELRAARANYGGFQQMKALVGEHEIGPAEKTAWMRSMNGRSISGGCGVEFGRHGLDTAEIRIFRGTLNCDTILSYLALYDYLVKWALDVDIDSLLGWNPTTAWMNFIEYVRKSGSEYGKHLLEYAKSKGVYA